MQLRFFIAFLLFCITLGPIAGCTASQRPPRVQEGKIAVKGGEIWYRIVGVEMPGVPMLVLHGGPGVPHDYLEPLADLADERPVVFYDQLGCGNSDRPADKSLWTIERFVDEVAAVRTALKLGRVHILGHSWGTALAAEYMLRHRPEGVLSLTMAGPFLSMKRWVADQRVWIHDLPEEVQGAIREAEARSNFKTKEYETAIGAFYVRHVCRLDPWPDYVQRALSPEKMGHDVYLYMNGPSEFTITGTLKDFERVDQLVEIKTPAIFICGRYDEATPAATEFYHRNMPGSEYAVIENASHLSHAEQPVMFNRIVRDFIIRTEANLRTRDR